MSGKEYSQKAAGRTRTDNLAKNVGQNLPTLEAARDKKPQRDSGIKMRAGNISNGVNHREHNKPESQRYTNV